MTCGRCARRPLNAAHTFATGELAVSTGVATQMHSGTPPNRRIEACHPKNQEVGDAPMTTQAVQFNLDHPVRLHPLVYLAEGDEVTIGRTDIDSYGIFPADGAAAVRRLADGDTPREVARWFEQQYGEVLEIAELLAGLDQLELVRASEQDGDAPARIRYQRLGRALFSPLAWACYLVLFAWAVLDLVRQPDLIPSYNRVFFSSYYTVIQLVLLVAAIPLVLLHESFHALAGRRLGVRSSMRLSWRFYFLVLETSLDGLVVVPRRKRYLPILAGMLADLVAVAAFIVIAGLTRQPDGSLSLVGRLLLAIAYADLFRIAWQFFFYLRTDIYVLISTVLGCVDLHTTAQRLLSNRLNRLLSRPAAYDETEFHPVDRRAAGWYCWLLPMGYTFSLVTLLGGGVPVIVRMARGVLHRLTTGGSGASHVADAVIVTVFTVVQFALVAGLAIRHRIKDRRRVRRLVLG